MEPHSYSPTRPLAFNLATAKRATVTAQLRRDTHAQLEMNARLKAEREKEAELEEVQRLRAQTVFKARKLPKFIEEMLIQQRAKYFVL